MRDEYDFTKGVKNPYIKKLKKQISINISIDVLDYFKAQSEGLIPTSLLIFDLYLMDCVANERKLDLSWK